MNILTIKSEEDVIYHTDFAILRVKQIIIINIMYKIVFFVK